MLPVSWATRYASFQLTEYLCFAEHHGIETRRDAERVLDRALILDERTNSMPRSKLLP